ncbi:shufflon system plasmid conjugative transfer pilus tip adhesin PilV [Serratia quinivorans]|uniref:shufflon system plasmid conjugative transfer pilus tip adhesin PilV n=1 Tax=Serratia quinivorans TaxID=137545 RepID=UPI002178BC85|nr:shufflon system plasmid conjugative transfer pilus tip adhesin PilV [Serratia quinivorans]CAI1006907.1 Bacterial shufflon protein, N-terminal constant region [Serratia quinivorans]CAI1807543.1 Bacterial shufflon protein, N-terminal constant region [Serratia quinivorans]
MSQPEMNYRAQRGFTLLETSIVLIVLLALLTLGAGYWHRQQQRDQALQAGQGVLRVSEAFKQYVQDRYQEVDALARSSGTAEITLATLTKENYLPAGTPEQDYRLRVNPLDTPPRLRLVTVSRNALPLAENLLPLAAAVVGPEGGYLSALQPDQVTGVHHGWQLPRSELAGLADNGQLVRIAELAAQDVLSAETFLHRDAQPGQPELNQMNTDLDMQFNQLRLGDGSSGAALAAAGLTLHDANGRSELAAGTLSINSGERSAGLSAGVLTLSQADLATPGVVQQLGSQLSSSWIKPARVVIPTGLATEARYKLVDDLCENADAQSVGRTFVLNEQSSDQDQLYMCGQSDRVQQGKGRGYLIATAGNNSDGRLEPGVPIKPKPIPPVAVRIVAFKAGFITGGGMYSLYDDRGEGDAKMQDITKYFIVQCQEGNASNSDSSLADLHCQDYTGNDDDYYLNMEIEGKPALLPGEKYHQIVSVLPEDYKFEGFLQDYFAGRFYDLDAFKKIPTGLAFSARGDKLRDLVLANDFFNNSESGLRVLLSFGNNEFYESYEDYTLTLPFFWDKGEELEGYDRYWGPLVYMVAHSFLLNDLVQGMDCNNEGVMFCQDGFFKFGYGTTTGDFSTYINFFAKTLYENPNYEH